MSTSHSRLFEASLAALLLADCDEEDLPTTAQARDQCHKPMAKHTLRTDLGESAPGEKEG
jgi:hypothetical protein